MMSEKQLLLFHRETDYSHTVECFYCFLPLKPRQSEDGADRTSRLRFYSLTAQVVLTRFVLSGFWLTAICRLLRPAAVSAGGHRAAGGGASGLRPGCQPPAVCQATPDVGRIRGDSVGRPGGAEGDAVNLFSFVSSSSSSVVKMFGVYAVIPSGRRGANWAVDGAARVAHSHRERKLQACVWRSVQLQSAGRPASLRPPQDGGPALNQHKVHFI